MATSLEEAGWQGGGLAGVGWGRPPWLVLGSSPALSAPSPPTNPEEGRAHQVWRPHTLAAPDWGGGFGTAGWPGPGHLCRTSWRSLEDVLRGVTSGTLGVGV